eukprot:6189720-Pleurochrysis_carterae.AAC.1
MRPCKTTCHAPILEHHQLIRILPGSAPAGTRSQDSTLAEDKYIKSERAYNVRSKKLFGTHTRACHRPCNSLGDIKRWRTPPPLAMAKLRGLFFKDLHAPA